jgi:trehalose-6-phosphate synthase
MPLRSFRLSLRFILPLVLVLGLFAYAILPMVDHLAMRWFVKDLDKSAQVLVNSMQGQLQEYVPYDQQDKIIQLFNRAIQDERLYALSFCDPNGRLLYKTNSYPASAGCQPLQKKDGVTNIEASLPSHSLRIHQGLIKSDSEEYLGKLILVYDMGFINSRTETTKLYVIALFAMLGVVVSIISVFVAHISWQGWINSVRGILRGDQGTRKKSSIIPEVKPLVGDLRDLLREFNLDRRLRDDAPYLWTPEKLRSLLHDRLSGDEVLVVSNREPYIHVHTKHGIEVQRPASGLVTAVEPVMRACSGTWIAHGAGSADRDTVDRKDHVSVPPWRPGYVLRRVWLSKEEEQGYYYGFANEGLWPLCHIAHVRPVFRTSDWEQYEIVNRRFADAVIKEARTDNPVILVQDYHFALLPRMVREALPKATIITFWHIPWPNPESFGICPWRETILEGLLGSTILGFHTPFHCKNFMETVDRYLEARIEHEASTISYGGELTQVESYPISIAWPDADVAQPSVADCRAEVRSELGLPAKHLLGIGVDRLDYTKGIIERFQAVERMLEMKPSLIGRFSLLQIAAPSRSSLDEYQNLEARVQALAQRINQRFMHGTIVPIILRIQHHDSDQVNRYYRAADVCLVTSLHDGMNLVAKEFIASRDDDGGVLILSQFTGAARELHEALIVNPYHIEQSAEALYRALTMPEIEQRERMRSMRSLVKNFNVYRWAGRMLLDAVQLRQRERIMTKIHSHSRMPLRRVI